MRQYNRKLIYRVGGQTYLAVLKILSQPLAFPTDSAVWTVIDTLRTIVVPELAYIAIVPRRELATVSALARSRLRRSTQHAEHVARFRTIQRVVFDRVVTEATCIPAATGGALDLDIPLVVLATKEGLFIQDLVFLKFYALRRRAVGGNGVFGTEVVVLVCFTGYSRKRRRLSGPGTELLEAFRIGSCGRARGIVSDDAGRRDGPDEMGARGGVIFCHEHVHPSRLFFARGLHLSYLVYLLPQRAHAVVGREGLRHVPRIVVDSSQLRVSPSTSPRLIISSSSAHTVVTRAGRTLRIS